MAHSKQAFAILLEGTPWRDNSRLYLSRLLEAFNLNPEEHTKQLRFKGIGRPRATGFPAKVLDKLFGNDD